jgi:hypothetical protein
MRTSISARRVLPVLAIVVVGAITSGCDAIGAIFNAGVMLVVAGIALVALVGMKVGRS